MKTLMRKGYIVSLFTLLLLLCLSACGTNFPTTTSSTTPIPSKSNNIPLGTGMNQEPGTNGKPAPLPNGHDESIIISNGVAYVGSDESLYALDTTSGAVLWSYKIGAPGTPVWVFSVNKSVVYATGNTGLYVLNVANGKLLWHYQGNKLISQVNVADGVVYAATSADNNASTITALQATDGRQLWNYTVATITPALMGAAGGVVYVSESTNGPDGIDTIAIDALQASNGHVLWKAQLDSGAGLANGGIVAVNGIVYFETSQGDLYALHADTGKVALRIVYPTIQGMPPNAPTPVVINGVVYLLSSQGIFAYSTADGTLIWQYKEVLVVKGPPLFFIPLTVVDGVVYSIGGPGEIIALRASDGKLLWQSHVEAVTAPLAVINGVVINYTGSTYALRASDGKLLWQQNVNISNEFSAAAGPETVGDGVVLAGGDNGVVQAIRISDGKLIWHYAIPEPPVQSPPVYDAYINFTPSTSYQQALEIVTSLGLKTFADCQVSWVSSDNKTFFANYHEMTVLATVNSAPLWFNRLQSTSGVQTAQPLGTHGCPNIRVVGPKLLPLSQANTYVQVTFANSAQYATALDAVNGLGFRLAAPCYEQARAQGKKPTWSSMDQSSTFNQSHALILATTHANAVTWQSQLKAVQSVVKVVAPFKATC